MFDRILVAIDGIEDSQPIVKTALSLANPAITRLLLLHAIRPEALAYPDMQATHLDVYPSLRRQMQLYLDELRDGGAKSLAQLRSLHAATIAAGVKADVAQPLGEPGQMICEQAYNWGADLIVMGRRGLTESSESILGSISNYVTHHAPCSVLIVQDQLYCNRETTHRGQKATVA